MRTPHPIALAALLAWPLGTFAQTAPAPDADAFVFKFQPPKGLRVVLTARIQRNRLIEGQPMVKDESEMKTEGVFTRVEDGFEYSPKVVAASMRRNGMPVDDPLIGLLSKVAVTYRVSPEGEAVDIKGYGDIESLVKSTLPAPLAAALAPVLSEAVLVEQQKAEWNARYADFADGEFRMGDVIDVQAPQALPNGETISYTIRTRFRAWETCPAGRCIRVEQTYESDAAELAKLAGGAVNRLAQKVSLPSPPSGAALSARVTGSLSRLIDPKTMLIYAERMKRTISMRVQVPGRGLVPTAQEETRLYSYVYE